MPRHSEEAAQTAPLLPLELSLRPPAGIAEAVELLAGKRDRQRLCVRARLGYGACPRDSDDSPPVALRRPGKRHLRGGGTMCRCHRLELLDDRPRGLEAFGFEPLEPFPRSPPGADVLASVEFSGEDALGKG
jgi:hypothetical protein